MDLAGFILEWLRVCWEILREAGVWLLVGFLIGGAIQALLPEQMLRRHLGRHGIGSIIKASIIGAPLPLCSCSVIPAAAALRRSGVSKGGAASFAVATPEIDAPSVAITWALLGWPFALIRPLAAFVSAVTVGLLVDLHDRRSADDAPQAVADPDIEHACGGCHHDDPDGTSPPEPRSLAWWRARLLRALRHALIDLPTDLGAWILVGIAISGLVVAAIPNGWIEAHVESGSLGSFGSMLLMLVIGIPWYICATASTPLAAALIAKGLSPGAGLVFLLAGPATNPATIGWVLRDLGRGALVCYLVGVSIAALAAGTLVNIFLPIGLVRMGHVSGHAAGSGLTAGLAAGALLVLLSIGVGRRVAGATRPSPQEG